MTRPQDAYPFDRNARSVILRVGTVAAVGTSTVDVDMPGGTRLTGVPSTFTPKVGAQIVVLLDRDNALAIGPVASGAPVWTPTTGMRVFHGTQTVAQSLPHDAFTPITWNTVDDPYGSWVAGTPARFKPTFAGHFILNGAVGFSSTAPATYAQETNQRMVAWYVNGGLWTVASAPNPAMIALAVTARTYPVYLNGTTDYVELAAYHDAGPPINTNVAPGYSSTITVTYAGP